MSQTVSAIFVDPESAERAIGALEDHGIRRGQISAVTLMGDHDADNGPGTQASTAVSQDEFLPVQTEGPPTPSDMNAATGDRFGDKGGAVSALEAEGKFGLTTTTAADARRGAVEGGVVGLGIGLLAGAATLLIPGVGLVLAAGPLWAALGAALGTSAAGVVAGGMTGYLVDRGVPAAVANRFGEALGTAGSVVVSVEFPRTPGEAKVREVEALLHKYGSEHVVAH